MLFKALMSGQSRKVLELYQIISIRLNKKLVRLLDIFQITFQILWIKLKKLQENFKNGMKDLDL